MPNAVVKRGGKFYLGSLNIQIDEGVYKGYAWNEAKPISRLSDVKDAASYKTLAAWLKEKDEKPELKDSILEATSAESIYLLDRPIDPTPEEFEDYWWSGINEECEKCGKSCKQSDKVVVVKCSQKQPIK